MDKVEKLKQMGEFLTTRNPVERCIPVEWEELLLKLDEPPKKRQLFG